MSESTVTSFTELALAPAIHKAIQKVGYEQPSPIQAAAIPHLLEGRDLIGIAQTGTGKTAAFALPMLSGLDTKKKSPQMLVLAPTRELAIQVAEACQSYASEMKGFHVLPIYGGQDMRGQLKQLQRGAQVIVGTPGRVMDHLRRGSLKLDGLTSLVLDEADEMLRMGFIDDVEWILDHIPAERQVALFSATMPGPIRKVADKYLNNPEEISIARQSTTGANIEQHALIVNGFERKVDAITRIFEAQDFDGVIIFVRTKTATVELAEKLEARGHSASALNGDMNQAPPMLPLAVLMCLASVTLSISTFLTIAKPTYTVSAVLVVLAAVVRPFCSWPRVKNVCYDPLKKPPSKPSRQWICQRVQKCRKNVLKALKS
jgi:ATP-dependent RNA helicase DeaD